MSIDKYIWAPSGVRAKQSITYRKYSSLDELIDELIARRGQKGFDEFDTELDHLPTGESRCDHRYKAVDRYGDVEWARCTRPATLRIRVIPAETVMATDGSGQETYTPLPAEAYEVLSCAGCYEAGMRSVGEPGSPADFEIIGKVDAPKGESYA